jgi:hypothetical protein
MFILGSSLPAADYRCFFCGRVRVAHPMDCCTKCGELARKRGRS